MFSYKLAKRLKDAGFPQYFGRIGKGDYISKTGLIPKYAINQVIEINPMAEYCYIPTLSELIEKCGEKIESFRLFCNFARNEFGVQKELQGLEEVKWYKTLKEAAAELWLKLNEPSR